MTKNTTQVVKKTQIFKKKLVKLPKTLNEKNSGRRIIVVLEKAPLDIVKTASLRFQKSNNKTELLNCEDHKEYLQKQQRDFSFYRPDIVHQCLLSLLDSPLNKCVNPSIRIPRTFRRFCGLFAELLDKRKIKAVDSVSGSSSILLRVISNPVSKYLPAGGKRIGLSVGGNLVGSGCLAKYLKSEDFEDDAEEGAIPHTFVVGAVSKDDPVSEAKFGADYVYETISISKYNLTAAVCCSKICNTFEEMWNIA